MNVLKAIKAASAFLIFSLSLTSCYPDGSRVVVDTDMIELRKQADGIYNVSVSEDMTLPEAPPQVNILKVQRKRFDDLKSIQEIFLKGRIIADTVTIEDEQYSAGETMSVYLTEDKFNLIVGRGALSFSYAGEDEHMEHIEYYISVCKSYCAEEILTKEEIDGFPAEDAKSLAEKALTDAGITNFRLKNTYAFTKDEGRRLSIAMRRDHNISEEDECYILQYDFNYEGINMVDEGMNIPDRENIGTFNISHCTSVFIAVKKDEGIVYFSGQDVTDSEYEVMETDEIKFNAAAAFKVLLDSYSSSSRLYALEYYDCELVYIPVQMPDEYSFILEPAWKFTYRYDPNGDIVDDEEPTETCRARLSKYINALTGNPLEMY